MLSFVILAALMLAAALAFVLPTLLNARSGSADPASDAQRKIKALEQARAEGLLNKDEYASKRAALGEQVLNWSGLPVVHVRATVFLQNFFFSAWAAESIAKDAKIGRAHV